MSGLAAQSSVPRKASEASLDSPLQSPEVPTNIPMSPISESKTVSAPTFSSAETPSPSHPPPTTKRKPPRLSLTPHLHLNPSDFLFGITLGEGAYARVVHARTKKGQEDFAVKIMEKRHIKKENKVKYVMMEKRLLSTFKCPLIVQLYSSFQDDDYLYMVMTMCAGGELLNVIRQAHNENTSKGIDNTAMNLASTQYFTAEILRALEYLHSKGVVHRDLKPENVLLTADGCVKVGDFGTALDLGGFLRGGKKTEGDSERHNSFVGTADYVSPEVLNNEDATAAVDLWALGCMVFQMLVGRTPFSFSGGNDFTMFNAIMGHADGTNPLTYPSEMCPEGVDLVGKLLVLKPDSRLGGGDGVFVDGDVNDYRCYNSIRDHSLFDNFSWSKLESEDLEPPYKPPEAAFLNDSSSSLIDGDTNLEQFFLEGEATPLQIVPAITVPNSTNSSSPQQNCDDGSDPRSSVQLDASNWRNHLLDITSDEVVLKFGKLSKRKNLFSRTRYLVLTSRPGLWYHDVNKTLDYKGNIPWSEENPIQIRRISDTKFDIVSNVGKDNERSYHFTDSEGNAGWLEALGEYAEFSRDSKSAR